MKRAAAAILLAALVCVGGAQAAVSVGLDRTQVATQIGRKFVFRSTIANRAGAPAAHLIAHLNVLSLRDGVYVDPEDWSSHRTRYLKAIPARGSTTVTWQMEAVNAGSFGVYVTVLPDTGAARPPAIGPLLHVTATQRRTLDSGGILPLALGIPGALAALAVALRLRRR